LKLVLNGSIEFFLCSSLLSSTLIPEILM
jgi:hypothetical protein